MSRSVLQTLIAHVRWADEAIVAALREAGAPPAEVLELFGHVLGAEHVWLARMHGRPAEVAVWPKLSVEECAVLAAANAEALAALVSSGDAVDRVVHYTNSAGAAFDSSLEEILVHVCMHGQYHRGQVNLLLRKAGLRPAPVDYVAFVRGAPAATRQP